MKSAFFGLMLMLASAMSVAGVTEWYPPVPAKKEHWNMAVQLAKQMQASVVRVADTRSMEPVITASDLLILRPTTIVELKVGDIVVFERRRSGGMLIGHRVIETKRSWVETKGDNLRDKDTDLTTQSMLCGRIEFLIDGQTGEIRDMRASQAGELVSLERVLERFRTGVAAAALSQASAAAIHASY